LIKIGRRKSAASESGLTSNESKITESSKRGRPAGKPLKKKLQLRDPKSFQTYIFRVLKEVKPELGIKKATMETIGFILIELFEKIMREARNLMIFSKKQTLTSKEIETAIKLNFPGELCKLAIQTGRQTLSKFAENNSN